MTNPNKTEIMIILDASGSMNNNIPGSDICFKNYNDSYKKIDSWIPHDYTHPNDIHPWVSQDHKNNALFPPPSSKTMRDFAIESFNSFIQKQKLIPGECNISLILFNTEYRPQYISKDIKEIPELDYSSYVPWGGTALNDTLGKAINKLGQRLSEMEENDRPDKVIICTITDGEENSSKEFNLSEVKEMINHQTNIYKWQFILVGTNNLNVNTMAQSRGISLDSAMSFAPSELRATVNYLSDTIGDYRKGMSPNGIKLDETIRMTYVSENK